MEANPFKLVSVLDRETKSVNIVTLVGNCSTALEDELHRQKN